MKKYKKIISFVCLIMLSAVLFAGCEDSNITKLRKDFASLNFTNYYGYMQTIEVQSSALSYTSYEKTIGFNGQNYKVIEKERVLNSVEASEQFTVTENTYYVVNGVKRELVDGKYKDTERAEVSLNLGIKIKEEYFKAFTVQEDSYGLKTFNGIILTAKCGEFLGKEVTDVNSMTLKVILKSNKLDTCIIEYTKTDNSKITMTTTFFTEAMPFTLPE